jgi:hypothetical protein
MGYATKSSVAIISGKSEDSVSSLFLQVADREVERICGKSFGIVTEDYEEYFDIDRRSVYFRHDIGHRGFPLGKFPVVSIGSVQLIYRNTDANNVVTTTTTTLTADEGYFLENLPNGAIIKLSGDIEAPIGKKVLKVTYNYGDELVPKDVMDYANFYAASLVEMKASVPTNSDGAHLSEIEIGRYREKYANPATVYKGKYGNFLTKLESHLESNYKEWP